MVANRPWALRAAAAALTSPSVLLGVSGSAEDRSRGTRTSHGVSRIHHIDPLASRRHDAEVVADEQHRHAQPLTEIPEKGEDLGLGGHVEGGGRLVGNQKSGPARQCDRQQDALPHSSGKLVGIGCDAARRQSDEVEELAYARVDFRGRRMAAHALGDLAPHPHDRIEIAQGILEHDRDGIAADFLPAFLAELGHVTPGDEDAAALDRRTALRQESSAARASVDLPEPDLPTRPTDSPSATARVTPSMARTVASRVR